MKYEIIEFKDVRIMGMSKEITFNNACSLEWYCGADINSPDYLCGIMMPIK